MDDIIDYMENNLHEMHGFKDYEVLKMKRDKDWMLAGTTDIERKRGDFYRFSSMNMTEDVTLIPKTFPK